MRTDIEARSADSLGKLATDPQFPVLTVESGEDVTTEATTSDVEIGDFTELSNLEYLPERVEDALGALVRRPDGEGGRGGGRACPASGRQRGAECPAPRTGDATRGLREAPVTRPTKRRDVVRALPVPPSVVGELNKMTCE